MSAAQQRKLSNGRNVVFPTAFSEWGEEEHAAIGRVMASGQFTMGDEVAAFEREFAAYHEMRYAIMTNSGSSANLLMVAALFNLSRGRLKRGDRAYAPALAWSTTYAPLVQHGLQLTLVDCDDTWNASLAALPPEPIQRPGVVVGCSILGGPAWSELWATAASNAGCYYVEDNCESLGAVSNLGNRCGTLGIMNSFSLFYSHQISAIEGGVVLTNDEECRDLCRMLRAHGWTRDVQSPRSFHEEYDFRVMGYNVRPTELHAAIARAQLKKLDSMIERRRQNLLYFRLRAMQRELPLTWPIQNGESSPFGIQFEVRDPATRQVLVSALRDRGVDCRLPTGGSMRRHRYGAEYVAQDTPRADRIHECGMFLGNGPIDLTSQIERAVEVMREVL